jgi:hypothetical protein
MIKIYAKNQNLIKQRLTFFALIIFVNLNFLNSTQATTYETIPQGSFIINMGVTPQTINNGLKPYGLIYAILNLKQGIEIKWAINPDKTKDGIDFTHNSIDYRGGAFIITTPFRTTAVNNLISAWTAVSGNGGNNGVVGATTVSAFIAPVYKTLISAPKWTLDKGKGDIAVPYFTNAGIPAAAHGGSNSGGWKNPNQLGACDDIFVMPHADATWNGYKNLFLWNRNFRGNIWGGCHSAGEIENLSGTTNNSDNPPNTAVKMNFLSTNGIFASNANPTPPFSHVLPENPVSQYLGITDGTQADGALQAFIPIVGSQWRAMSHRITVDPTHPDRVAASTSVNVAAINVWGRAFDDDNRGLVMYQAGHDLDKKGTLEEKIASQRIFFNFSFLAAEDRRNAFTISVPQPINVTGGRTFNNVSATITSTISSTYTYLWSSPCSEITFTAPTSATTNITVANVTQDKVCTFNLRVEDACGRVEVKTYFVNMFSKILPPIATNTYFQVRNVTAPIAIPAFQGAAADTSISSFTITSLPNPLQGTLSLCTPVCLPVSLNQVISYANRGNLKFTPNNNFVGTSTYTYSATDANGLISLPANYTITTDNYQPTAQNNALPTVSNTTSTDIPLRGFDADGFLISYRVTSPLPDPTTQGTLTYCSDAPLNTNCNVVLTQNTTLTNEQAQTIKFTPVNSFTGNINIPFITIDNNNNHSAEANLVLWVNATDEIYTAPIADNIIASPITNSVGLSTIPPLRGGNLNLGEIVSFTITELPNAAHGQLFFCDPTCTPVTLNQVILYDDATLLKFNPNPNYVGNATFKYTATNADLHVSSVASFVLPVINHPPMAQNLFYGTINENTTSKVALPSISGLDEDGTIASFRITKLPTGGDLFLCNPVCSPVVLNQLITYDDASKLSYTPHNNYTGTDVFEYIAIDNNDNNSQFATYGIVTKSIITNELGPIARNISVSTNSFTPVVIIPELNAISPSGNSITNYIINSLPHTSEGTLRLCVNPPSGGCTNVTLGQSVTPANADNLVFVPNQNFLGISNFNYYAIDNQSYTSNIATISASVSNIAPMAKDVIQQSIYNYSGPTTLDRPLLATDADGSVAYYTIMSVPTPNEGLLSVCANPPTVNCVNVTPGMTLTPTQVSSQMVFDPNPSFNGYVFFGYSATDNSNNISNPALVTIMTGGFMMLPVKIASFDVTKQNTTAIVTWTTAMEENINYFEVERSIDGVNFFKIGKVNATGNEFSATNYQYIDKQPNNGLNYYRIKSVQFNNTEINSVVRVLNFDAVSSNTVNVYPNPFSALLNINSDETIEQIEVTDLTGKVIFKQVDVNQNSVQLNTAEFDSGIYYLLINDKAHKIIKY